MEVAQVKLKLWDLRSHFGRSRLRIVNLKRKQKASEQYEELEKEHMYP